MSIPFNFWPPAATMQLPPFSSSSSATALCSHEYCYSFVVVVAMTTILFSSLLLLLSLIKWQRPRNKRLPPGSMGWPYIGETLKLYSQDPNSFFSRRQQRYVCMYVCIHNTLKLASKAHIYLMCLILFFFFFRVLVFLVGTGIYLRRTYWDVRA